MTVAFAPLNLGIDAGLLAMPVLLLLCASLGRRLGAEGVFAQSLWGLAFVALPAAVLCGFRADLAAPALTGGLALAAALSGWDFKTGQASFSWRKTLGFGALFLLFALLNLPEDALLHRDGAITRMDFNGHFSYYASLSNELLRADYPSRLRVMSAWPLAWSRYHFFPGATQAALQILSPAPNLGTYFQAQLTLAFFVLMSFAQAVGVRGVSRSRIAFWLLVVFTFFGPFIGWQMTTSATFGVFALFFGLWSLATGNRGFAFLCGVLLLVSSPRNLPAAGVIALFAMFRERGSLRDFLAALFGGPWRAIFLVLAAVAVLTALLLGAPLRLEPAEPLAAAWWESLLGTQARDHWRSLGAALGAGGDVKTGWQWTRSGVPGLLGGVLSLGIFLWACVRAFRALVRTPRLRKFVERSPSAVTLGILVFIAALWGIAERVLSPVAVFGLFFYGLLLFTVFLKAETREFRAAVAALLTASFLATWVVPKALAYPALMTSWDMTLLAGSALYMVKMKWKRVQLLAASALLVLWLQPRATRFFWLAHDDVHGRRVDVSEVLSAGFGEKAVADGFLKSEFAGADLDLTAALLGARLRPGQTQPGIELIARPFAEAVERKDEMK